MSSEELHSYLDHGALLDALRVLTGRSDVEVDGDVTVNRATKGIEGFLSLVLRVKVPYRCGDEDTKEATIVLKCMPRMEPQLTIVKSTRVFPREGTFYQNVFPLLREASGGKVPLLVPTVYYTRHGGDDDAFYIEDFGAQGFRTPTVWYRTNGLDFDHCRLAMEAYGRFHALTTAAEKLLPEDKSTWVEACPELAKDAVLYSPAPGEPPIPFMGMIHQGVETFLDIAKELDGLPKEAEECGKLRSVMENAWSLMKKLGKTRVGEQNVLSHGDCWMNNNMFRYEEMDGEQKPVDIRLVDFQIVRYCHPSIDLINYLFLNARNDFRTKHMSELLRIYYDSFVKCLEDMQYGPPPFTLDKFLYDFHNVYLGFGILVEGLALPLVLLGEDLTPADADEFTSEKFKDFVNTASVNSVRSRYSNDPRYRSSIDEIVRYVVSAIFIDGLDSPISPLFCL